MSERDNSIFLCNARVQWRTGEYKQGTYPKVSHSSSKDGVIRYVDANLKGLTSRFRSGLVPIS
jgi:hypothetical protein